MTQLEKLHVSPCLNRCHHEGATHWQCFRTKPGAQSGRPGLRINTYLRVLYRPGTNFQGKLAAEPELVHPSTRSVIQSPSPNEASVKFLCSHTARQGHNLARMIPVPLTPSPSSRWCSTDQFKTINRNNNAFSPSGFRIWGKLLLYLATSPATTRVVVIEFQVFWQCPVALTHTCTDLLCHGCEGPNKFRFRTRRRGIAMPRV
ncbi:hypothetical protein V8E55_008967 [Tylopilus felleus]